MTDAFVSFEGPWWEVFGRTHMLVLHFPIALLVVALVLELTRLGARPGPSKPRTSASGVTCVVLGSLGALVAAWSGWVYAENEFGAGSQLDWHRWSGVVTAGVSLLVLLFALASRLKTGDRFAWPYRVFLLLAAAGVTLTGHLGGELVHGEGFVLAPLEPDVVVAEREGARQRQPAEPGAGTDAPQSGPNALTQQSDPGSPPDASRPVARRVSFKPEVYAILQDQCLRCHSAERARGEVVLATEADTLTYVTRGNANASLLVHVLELPESDPGSMPKNRKPLPTEQVQLIRDWINGLSSTDTEADPEVAPVEVAVATRQGPPPKLELADLTLTEEQRTRRDATIARLRARGVAASVRARGIDEVEVRVLEDPADFQDTDLQQLQGLEPCVTILDLTGTAVTDDGLASLSAFEHLRKLRVGNTRITDAGLAKLKELGRLQTLDVHQTNVTLEGLRSLANLTDLHTLYAWGTNLTQEEVQTLRKALPEVEVTAGE